MKDYISSGLSNLIIDHDGGANLERTLQSLRSATTGDGPLHPNFSRIPRPPTDPSKWTYNLSTIPTVTFDSIFRHYSEKPIAAAMLLTGDPCDADDESEGTQSDTYVIESSDYSSVRPLTKGYRFFNDGHVTKISLTGVPLKTSAVTYVKCKVLPSMRKSLLYDAMVCLDPEGDVLTATCTCVAGLAGCCNHIAGLLYALEDFVRLALREESSVACTSKLQAWNRPRARKLPPVAD